jgi:dihydroorotase
MVPTSYHKFLTLFFASALAATSQQYDLLLKGGTVIDPKNGVNAVHDVAIANGKIAAVAASIPTSQAKRTVNAQGLYVTPGLIDIHVHVYAGTGVKGSYSGDNSVYPDDHSFRACTTTMVDAGSSGAQNFDDFKQRIIDRARTRVLAFINIVNRGMGGGPIEQDLGDMNVDKTIAAIKANPETIIGIKTAHYAGPEWDPVDRAVAVGNATNRPVMVDFGIFRIERPHSDLVLKHLRPGDIYTHMYLDRVPMLDKDGKVRSYLFEAKKRGVKLDVGHGAGSFVWKYAVPATKQGLYPDSISTDLHIASMNAGMKDMTNVMSKMLNLNMPLASVIEASTWNPAKEIKREELGHLTVGAEADVSVLSLNKGDFGFLDVDGKANSGSQKLGCEMTIRAGKVQWDLNARAADRWDSAK